MDLNSRARSFLKASPIFYSAQGLFRSRKVRRLYVSSTTDVLIDGFPRSANTYSVVCFAKAQSLPCVISHHTHAVANILRGVKLGIPTILLVREPLDAASSFALYSGTCPIESLQMWLGFYSRCLRVLDSCVVAEFSSVVSDFGVIVEELNRKHSTRFAVPIMSQEAEKSIRQDIDDLAKFGDFSELQVARPSAVRHKRAKEVRAKMEMDARLCDRARRVYEEVLRA